MLAESDSERDSDCAAVAESLVDSDCAAVAESLVDSDCAAVAESLVDSVMGRDALCDALRVGVSVSV